MLSIKSFWKLRSKKLLILCAFGDDREQYSDDDDTLGGWSRWRMVAARTVIGNEISPLHLQCTGGDGDEENNDDDNDGDGDDDDK